MRKAKIMWVLSVMHRDIARSPVKSAALAAIALLAVLSLCRLSEAIGHADMEIRRLNSSIPVNASIGRRNSSDSAPFRQSGNLISPWAVSGVLGSGHVKDVYLEAAHEWSVAMPLTEGTGMPSGWVELAGLDASSAMMDNEGAFEGILATGDLEMLMIRNSRSFVDEIPGVERQLADGSPVGDMAIEFAPGHDASYFAFSEGSPIPIILSEETMRARGLSLGDNAFIAYAIPTTENWRILTWQSWLGRQATVIGSHNRNVLSHRLRDAAIVPIAALEGMLGRETGYTALEFTLDTMSGTPLSEIREFLEDVVSDARAGWAVMSVTVHDEELKAAVGSMEKSLSLLRYLYPITAAASAIIGFGLSMLLMHQKSREAAIMRSLGSSKRKVAFIYTTSSVLLSVAGALAASAAAAFSGSIGIGAASLLSGAYLASALAGSLTGAVLITRRPPLELLQVKE